MRTQEKHATRFRSIQTSLLFVIVPAVIISMAVLSLMGYLSSKAIIQTSAGNEMSQCLSVAMGSIEMSLSNNRMVAETMARGVEAVQRQAVKGEQTEVLPKSWTKVMRQSHFEFCIGQDLTHSIFL